MGQGPDFRAFFDTVAVPYAIMDRDFRYVALNAVLEETVGRPKSEMLGRGLFELFPEIEERQAVVETAFTAAFEGRPTGMAEVPYSIPVPGKPGEKREIWWTFHCHPIPSANGRIDYIGFHAENVTREVRDRALKKAITEELHSRVRNTLSLVQTIARRTVQSYPDMDAFIEHFDDRIVSLAQTHSLMTGANWDGLTFEALLIAQLGAHRDLLGTRIHLDGPVLLLSSFEAQALSMAIHELLTNATEHGALSDRNGQISIAWTVLDGDGYTFMWQESGLADFEIPTSEGYGADILNRILPAQLVANANHRFTEDSHTYKIVVEQRRKPA